MPTGQHFSVATTNSRKTQSGRVTSNKLCDKYDNVPSLNMEFPRCIVILAFSDIDTCMVNAIMFLKLLLGSFTTLSPASHVNFLSWTSPLIKNYGFMLALVTETQSHALRHCLNSARNICIDYILNIPKFVCNPEQNVTESWTYRLRLSSIQAMCCKNFRWNFLLTSWLTSSTDLHMKIKFSYINKLINKIFIH
jgi:hypothetical protein